MGEMGLVMLCLVPMGFVGALIILSLSPKSPKKPRPHRARRAARQPQWDEDTFEPPWLYEDYRERPEDYEGWQ
jgi:hypothetical protein